jgi:Zn-finger nucleic acid-binding protein
MSEWRPDERTTHMSTLTCPKCHGDMRQYERSGVHVDQCTECRGIFLDRGELEGLVDAELRWAAQANAPVQAPPPPVPAAPAPQGYQQPYPPQQPQGYPPQQQGYPPQQYGKPPKRKKSFLEDIFD